jgi:hypothetical protein
MEYESKDRRAMLTVYFITDVYLAFSVTVHVGLIGESFI